MGFLLSNNAPCKALQQIQLLADLTLIVDRDYNSFQKIRLQGIKKLWDKTNDILAVMFFDMV